MPKLIIDKTFFRQTIFRPKQKLKWLFFDDFFGVTKSVGIIPAVFFGWFVGWLKGRLVQGENCAEIAFA